MASLNAVQAIEEGIASPPRRSHAISAASLGGSGGSNAGSARDSGDGNPAAGSPSSADITYRSDSLKRVYQAQHHFVIAQLTAPGVDAFLADDFSDDEEEEGGSISRSASKFV